MQHSPTYTFPPQGTNPSSWRRYLLVYLPTRPPALSPSLPGASRFKEEDQSSGKLRGGGAPRERPFPPAGKMSFVLRLASLRHNVSDNTGQNYQLADYQPSTPLNPPKLDVFQLCCNLPKSQPAQTRKWRCNFLESLGGAPSQLCEGLLDMRASPGP